MSDETDAHGAPMTAAARLEAAQARRAERRAATAAKRDEQAATDLEAVDALEEKHGEENLIIANVDRYEIGLPTLVVGRIPSPVEFKRYQDEVARAGDNKPAIRDATDRLASVCRIYPDDNTYSALRAVRPAIHVQFGAMCAVAAGTRRSDEGKG